MSDPSSSAPTPSEESEDDRCLDQLRHVGTPNVGRLASARGPAEPLSDTSSMEEQLRSVSAVIDGDLAAIRQKILAGRGESGGAVLTPEEERKLHQEVRQKHQVDLNEESNIGELEDKRLMGHMVSARKSLAEQERRRLTLPRFEEVRAQHVKNKQQVSGLIQRLQEVGLETQCGVEDTFLQSSNTTKLASGSRPHAFPEVPPEVPPNRAALVMLAQKISGAGSTCQKTITAISDTVNQLDVLRRDQEVVVDALVSLYHHYRASHEALEHLLGTNATPSGPV